VHTARLLGTKRQRNPVPILWIEIRRGRMRTSIHRFQIPALFLESLSSFVLSPLLAKLLHHPISSRRSSPLGFQSRRPPSLLRYAVVKTFKKLASCSRAQPHPVFDVRLRPMDPHLLTSPAVTGDADDWGNVWKLLPITPVASTTTFALCVLLGFESFFWGDKRRACDVRSAAFLIC
jgi:hypothetical protein